VVVVLMLVLVDELEDDVDVVSGGRGCQ